MNLKSTMKNIAPLAILLTALVVSECFVTQARATPPSAGSITASCPSELVLIGGPLGTYRAGADDGKIGLKFGQDGGPLG